MADIESRLKIIAQYLNENLDIDSDNLKSLDDSINLIHQPSPLDGAGVFTRVERAVSASDNLSWLITMVCNRRCNVSAELKKLKDPQFTLLVRQQRPSTQAIESEIRWTNEEVAALEDKLATIDNIINYLNSIESNIDRYIWILREKARFINK